MTSELRRTPAPTGCARAPHLAVLTLLAACGGDAAPDAPVEPPRDATVAADAVRWSCEPQRPDLPPATTAAPTVVFDTSLPLYADGDGMAATFVEADGIVVATSRQLHFLTLDGELVRNLPFALAGATSLGLDTVAADGGFGSVVRAVIDGVIEWKFCLVDREEGLLADTCVDLDGGPVSPTFELASDGSGYAVFSPRGGSIHAWRFDAAGTLVEELDLWVAGPEEEIGSLMHGASYAGVDLFVTSVLCDSVLHRVASTGHTAASIVPPTLTVSGITNFYNWAASGAAVAMLAQLNCRAVPGECAEVGHAPGALLSRVDLATGNVVATMVPMPFVGHVPLFIDGEKTGAVYTPGLYDMRFSRFTAEGEAEISEMRLPLSYLQTGIELQNLGATATLAPGDYVFVYEGTGVGVGRRRNVARIQVP